MEKKLNETEGSFSISFPYKYLKDKYGLLGALGLFIPMPLSNYKSLFKKTKYGWVFTIEIGIVPLGWAITIPIILINHLWK